MSGPPTKVEPGVLADCVAKGFGGRLAARSETRPSIGPKSGLAAIPGVASSEPIVRP
jgi:hypothetical protein